MSYSDLDLRPCDFIHHQQENDFVVHAPELFSDSHLMDLASLDEGYRQVSLRETQRVINMTRDLQKLFPKTERPLIVANIGGFSMDAPLDRATIKTCYTQFEKSLCDLDFEGVELIPQTMAPFPWHFGGQRYQNLFVTAEAIVDACKRFNLRMCLDTSHSLLTCNEFGYDFDKFVELVAPFTAHIHVADAKGVNGEGLQIGEGETDFKALATVLESACPSAGFIPEIWQGHKNNGEGFWLALDRLEGVL